MTQEEFGDRFGIGNQSMVSQYMLGTRPLNYDAAAKFAKGFDCSIEDICPDMARAIYKDIIPVLRRSLRRRKLALLALGALLWGFGSDDANALGRTMKTMSASVYYVKSLRWLMMVLDRLYPRVGASAA
jgi:transcriptional regulator with XRE-family HTH domain